MAVAPLSSSDFPLSPEQLRFLATCTLLLATAVRRLTTDFPSPVIGEGWGGDGSQVTNHGAPVAR